MANVIILSFSIDDFERRELSRMSDQELYDLWAEDENNRVKSYDLDEFTCALNDEMVNDQDNWFFPCDMDKVNVPGCAKKIKVEAICDEFYVAESLHELATNIECGDILDGVDEVEVSGDHYTAGVKTIYC